jgi:hypothetical protein
MMVAGARPVEFCWNVCTGAAGGFVEPGIVLGAGVTEVGHAIGESELDRLGTVLPGTPGAMP